MNKIIVCIATCASLISCSHKEHGYEAEAPHDDEHHDEIVLQPETAHKMGVAVEEVQPADFNTIIKVSGQIADSPESMSVVCAPTSGVVTFAKGIVPGKAVAKGAAIATISAKDITGGDPNASALVAMEAARKELEHLKALYDKQLVTADVYRKAELDYNQAKAAYSGTAASGRAVAVSTGVISSLLTRQGEYVEAGTPLATVSSVTNLSVKANVPESYYQILPTITRATIKAGDAVAAATRQGSGALAAAEKGYIPVYFNVENNGGIVPGSFVEVYMIGASKSGVISVPLSAISEQQGSYFVYEQIDEEGYRKLPVTLGSANGERVEILAGVESGQRIVTSGATAVRLAETATVAPEGHSHNH